MTIFGGDGCRDAHDEVVSIARKLKAPVGYTFRGKQYLEYDNPQAVGQIYNLTDGEFVSKRQFIEAICDALGLDKPTGKPPLWVAKLVTWISEKKARMTGAKQAPKLTFAKLKFMGYNLDFSIEKAKRELGYLPRYTFKDGMYETMAYYKQ